MGRKTKIVVIPLILLFVSLVAVIVTSVKLIQWDIAANYKGWAVVTFEDRNCRDVLPSSKSTHIQIDKTGKGCASFPFPRGWIVDQFFYVDDRGSRTRISSSQVWPLGYNFGKKQCVLFVGTEAERDKSWNLEPPL
jgi:uncharacterized protein DUF6843